MSVSSSACDLADNAGELREHQDSGVLRCVRVCEFVINGMQSVRQVSSWRWWSVRVFQRGCLSLEAQMICRRYGVRHIYGRVAVRSSRGCFACIRCPMFLTPVKMNGRVVARGCTKCYLTDVAGCFFAGFRMWPDSSNYIPGRNLGFCQSVGQSLNSLASSEIDRKKFL